MFWVFFIYGANLLVILDALLNKNITSLIVRTNQPIEIPCNYEQRHISTILWTRIPLGESKERYIYVMSTNEIDKNYKALCEPNKQSCNLVLIRADKESSGTYICAFLSNNGKTYTVISVVELVVGELHCESNIRKNDPMIGENDCPGIDPDTLDRSCSFDYYGNPDVDFQLGWTNNREDIFINNYRQQNDALKSIKIHDKITVTAKMNDIIFECFIREYSNLGTCALSNLEVKYLKPLIENTLEMNMDNLHHTTCEVNKSHNINCSYIWEYKNKDSKFKFYKQILSSYDITLPGLYTCTAICQLKASKECKIRAMELVVIQADKHINRMVMGLIIPVVVFVVTVLALFIYFQKQRKQSRNEESESEMLISKEKKINLSGSAVQDCITRPSLSDDLIDETFSDQTDFTDPDEFLFVHLSLIQRFDRWVRVSDLLRGTAIRLLLLDEQDLSENSLFFYLLFQHERKFKKKIISNMIYPQNEQKETKYNPSGKYIVKFYLNGTINKITIDDKLPVDKNGDLLCLFSKNKNTIWLSLLEKAYDKLLKTYVKSAYDIDNLLWITGWIPFKYYTHDKLDIQKIINEYRNGNCFIHLNKNSYDDKFYVLMDVQESEKNCLKLQYQTFDTFISKLESETLTGNYYSVQHCFDTWKKDYFSITILRNPDSFVFYSLCQNQKNARRWSSDGKELNINSRYKLEIDSAAEGATVYLILSKKNHDNFVHKCKMSLYIRNENNNKKMFQSNSHSSQRGEFVELIVSPGHYTFSLFIYHRKSSPKVKYNLNIHANAKFTITKQPPVVFQQEECKIVSFPFRFNCDPSQTIDNWTIIYIEDFFHRIPRKKFGRIKMEKITSNNSTENYNLVEEKRLAPDDYCYFIFENISGVNFKFSICSEEEDDDDNIRDSFYSQCSFRVEVISSCDKFSISEALKLENFDQVERDPDLTNPFP